MDSSPTNAETSAQSDVERRIRALDPWFHNMVLKGVRTAPHHFLGDYPEMVWQTIAPRLPQDLRGMTVLDIGCNAGFFSIQMKRRGADRVVGIDHDPHYLKQAELAIELSGAKGIELRQVDVYDVGALREKFDLVLFMGVLYHLRHPLLALDLLWEHVTKDWLVVQTLTRGSRDGFTAAANYPFDEEKALENPAFPRMYFIEKRYADDPTNWWIPNRSCTEAMLRSSGFVIEQMPAPEMFICRRGTRGAHNPGATYPARGETH